MPQGLYPLAIKLAAASCTQLHFVHVGRQTRFPGGQRLALMDAPATDVVPSWNHGGKFVVPDGGHSKNVLVVLASGEASAMAVFAR